MLPACTPDKIKRLHLTDDISEIARRVGCSDLAAAVLSTRVGPDPESMIQWLKDNLEELLSSVDLGPGAAESKEQWGRAVSGKRILVYGDYDVDGIASSALAVEMAGAAGAELVRYYIPHRQKEGYGVQLPVIKKAASMGFHSVIITDCGSKDREAVDCALENGMSVMVFDHHSMDGDTINLPSFVNPQKGGDFEARKLCATAVLWVWAYTEGVVPKRWLMDRLDLVAMATISDCMGLGKLNRAMVNRGMRILRHNPRPGIRELCSRLDVNPSSVDEEVLSMKIIPCLNAAGRLDFADLALSVVLNGDRASLDRLEKLNETRKEMSKSLSSSLSEVICESGRHVFFDGKWPVGLLSAVASRMCGAYGEGFALAGPSGKGIRGTLRVPEGGNAVEILSELDDLLEAWGGHAYAAGFSLQPSRWDELSARLEDKLRSIVSVERIQPAIDFDPGRFDLSTWEDLRRIGPFGTDNPCPSFYVPRNGREKLLPLGSEGIHGKIDLGSSSLIAFNGAAQHRSMDGILGWLYRPRINYWNGKTNVQFVVEKIVVSC